jgi:hypothetical protein
MLAIGVYLGVAVILALDLVAFIWRKFKAIVGKAWVIKQVIINLTLHLSYSSPYKNGLNK